MSVDCGATACPGIHALEYQQRFEHPWSHGHGLSNLVGGRHLCHWKHALPAHACQPKRSQPRRLAHPARVQGNCLWTGPMSNDDVAYLIQEASPSELEVLLDTNDAALEQGSATILDLPSGSVYHDVCAPGPPHPRIDDPYHGGIFKSFEGSHSEANGSLSTWDIYSVDGMLTCWTWGQSYLSLLCINQKQDLASQLIPPTTYHHISKVLHQALPIHIVGPDYTRCRRQCPGSPSKRTPVTIHLEVHVARSFKCFA
jgi:hypothetical protein